MNYGLQKITDNCIQIWGSVAGSASKDSIIMAVVAILNGPTLKPTRKQWKCAIIVATISGVALVALEVYRRTLVG